ncbi:alcohol dehydrogenase-like regulatory protein ErcA [Methanocella arvoryzae]|uniref:Iron-containing alcohol dehydrogenase n=1 Tax=Methanocella arvoryzae (strain DSM 22066 / NBRC 105507 / MRE50) TaxID=351160 RepID=Q0W1B1_METAR|nr:alcohol dehydrogenase-like regulatory protein ErcA [Methanocella arvoryzae]CAJ37832.1 putative iron-containing alcohol dehydrogenase [Methanocella arvoryzae MRE50]
MTPHKSYELRKFVSPEFVFGSGSLRLAGRYATNFGASKVFVVTDKGVIEAGWTRQVTDSLEEEDLPFIVFSNVSPNPRSDEVMQGVKLYREAGCDVIVAVGGGSPIDCAKGIGIVSTNNRDVMEFEGVDQIPIPGPPLICIPTTAGSSADLSQFAIITDLPSHRKAALVSKMLVPDTSLIDPDTTLTMPKELTAITGLDAFTHAVEAYVSNASSPITDLFALNAVRLITSNLLKAIDEPDNMDYRSNMMLASLEAGLAFSNASLGATHAMAHSLGGVEDTPHGESNSLLLKYVMEFNYDAVPQKYEAIGEAMGLDLKKYDYAGGKNAVLEAVAKLIEACGVRGTLAQRGVRREDIPRLSRQAIKDVCMVTNPRPMSLEDVERIYERAL